MKNYLMSLIAAALLMGCATSPAPKPEIGYIFVKVPTTLTARVTPSLPFEAQYYSVQTTDVKEKMLFDLITQRTTELGVCNARLDGVNSWSITQAIIYDKESP